MKNDTLIRVEGMEALMEKLGLVEAERFIMLNKRERFDYTRWRQTQFEGKGIEVLYAEAAALRAQAEAEERAKTVKQVKLRPTARTFTKRRKVARQPAHV